MKHVRKRLTYANVMSSIAVFLVLGGATAVAAKKIGSNEIKGNSITTGKLKKEAVTTAKIKKNSITTAKIKNGAVTGAKVNLGTLGTVPSANTANVANSLLGRTPFSFFSTPGTRTVASIGPFTIQARCAIGATDEAELQLLTAVANAAMDDNSGDEFSVFNPTDNPAELILETAASGVPDFEADSGQLVAVAPDGTTIATENQAVGVNVAGRGGQCFFAGTIVKLS